MADGYRFDILEKRAERKAHLDDIGVATLPDQPGKRGYSAAESRMHFKAPVDYLFSLLCGCMEEVGSEFDGYLPLSGGTMSGAIISEGTGRKATLGDGILKLEDTVYGRETEIGKYAIIADGGNFYYPSSSETGGTLITDKWPGFQNYLPISGGEITGEITTNNDELQQKVYFGNGRIGVQDTDDGAITYFDANYIERVGNKFYYPERIEENGGNLITDKWRGFSDYLTKADAESEYAKKADLNGYATKADLGNYATKADLGNYATKKDFDDLKSIVYGIHSLTYNSYEFSYLTSSAIPDEVDGRKTVGGSYAIADWVGGNSLRWTTNILGSNGPKEYVIESGITGKNIYLANSSGTWRVASAFSGDMDAIGGHKYLAIVRYDETVAPASESNPALLGFWNSDSSYTRASLSSSEGRYRYGVFTPNKDYLGCACVFQRFDTNKAKCTISDFRAAIWDLTANGDDSLTDAQAFAKYKGYFDADTASGYSESIKSTIVSKIESWGYNLFDGELEIGAIDRATGQDTANANSLRSKNYIHVVAGKTYTLETNLSASQFTEGYILEYDKDKNYIGYQVFNRPVSGTANQKTLSNDTRFVRLRYYGTTNLGGVIPANETCFHRTGSRTGYAPYVGKLGEINIPNAPLKLDGVNDIHNLLTFEEQSDGSYNAILNGKFALYDMGTMAWFYVSNETRFYSPTITNLIKKSGGVAIVPNLLCSKYQVSRPYDIYDKSKDKVISVDSDGNVLIRDTAYTSGAALKEALSGTYLLFERATPTTETIATGLTFDKASFPIERGGSIEAVYEEVPPTASIDFMTKGE